ncbi:MAG: hypothetical protein U5R49_27155 [Deltaproteobacteria bacterium]|nr:hypothetical protein [Deltaproteobacteria bacterium]
MTRKAIDTIVPYLDGANVDLKAWSEDYYATHCQAHLKPVLDSIRHLKASGVWLEVTTLVVPGENDASDQLAGIAGFIAEVDAEIPWHISRFHPDYRFTDAQPTPMETLYQAKTIAEREGLRYVYIGNAPADNHTYCPECGRKAVERGGMGLSALSIQDGNCTACGARIPGIWV